MAESFIEVTAGTGTKAHSNTRVIGANTVHDEVVIPGEPYLASYTIVSELAATSTLAVANDHLLQIMAGSTLKVYIRRIEVIQYSVVTAAAFFLLRLHRLTTAGTGGTGVTPRPLDTTDAAAGTTAQVRPTSKGTEGVLVGGALPYTMQTLAASNAQMTPIYAWDFDRPRSKSLIIPAGTANGIAVKNISTAAAGALVFQVWFDEANF